MIMKIEKRNDKDAKKCWDYVNNLGPQKMKNIKCESLDEHGEITKDPTLCWNKPPDASFDEEFLSMCMQTTSNYVSNTVDHAENADMNYEMSSDEVLKTVKHEKKGKDVGMDRVP